MDFVLQIVHFPCALQSTQFSGHFSQVPCESQAPFKQDLHSLVEQSIQRESLQVLHSLGLKQVAQASPQGRHFPLESEYSPALQVSQ